MKENRKLEPLLKGGLRELKIGNKIQHLMALI
jgi:hypothetical protein